jgi:hypothetical protein
VERLPCSSHTLLLHLGNRLGGKPPASYASPTAPSGPRHDRHFFEVVMHTQLSDGLTCPFHGFVYDVPKKSALLQATDLSCFIFESGACFLHHQLENPCTHVICALGLRRIVCTILRRNGDERINAMDAGHSDGAAIPRSVHFADMFLAIDNPRLSSSCEARSRWVNREGATCEECFLPG